LHVALKHIAVELSVSAEYEISESLKSTFVEPEVQPSEEPEEEHEEHEEPEEEVQTEAANVCAVGVPRSTWKSTSSVEEAEAVYSKPLTLVPPQTEQHE